MAFNLTPVTTFWLGLGIVLCFVIWQYIIKPVINEGQPIHPPKTEDEPDNIGLPDDIFDGSLGIS